MKSIFVLSFVLFFSDYSYSSIETIECRLTDPAVADYKDLVAKQDLKSLLFDNLEMLDIEYDEVSFGFESSATGLKGFVTTKNGAKLIIAGFKNGTSFDPINPNYETAETIKYDSNGSATITFCEIRHALEITYGEFNIFDLTNKKLIVTKTFQHLSTFHSTFNVFVR